ncbi:MAG TPA: phosphatase PAP2 family protein [Jatrophihabitans sp.]|nr:phosphatase PAP2 family protein [Jatrophihabitans sp.]
MSSNRSLVQAGPSTRPQPAGQVAVAPFRRPRIIGELLVVLLLLWAYDMVRGHAEVREVAALRNGRQLLDVERWLHIDVELSANLWTTQRTALALVASYWYQFAHLSVTLAMLVWCWWRRAHSYRRARNALVLTNVFGLAIFLVYPAAPPRFLPGFGFVDAVANAGFGPTHGGPVTADQFGAFPSLHLAWAVWTAVVAYRLVRSQALRRLWLCYPLITAVVVVVTGNHYLLDILAGGLIALVTLTIAHRIPGRRTEDRHQPSGWPASFPSPAYLSPANLSRRKNVVDARDGELVPTRPDR